MPVIHAIIITFNPDKDNVLLLSSTLNQQVAHTWIIDNGSSTDISKYFFSSPNVTYLKLEENVGIAKAQI